MSSNHFTPMTWELVDQTFGPEPGVFWDRDMADCGWDPLLYVQETRELTVRQHLRAHCPLHRAPDRWPTDAAALLIMLECRCMHWDCGEWHPRFIEEDITAKRAETVKNAVHDCDATEPGLRRALQRIPTVSYANFPAAPLGHIRVELVRDPSDARTHHLDASTVSELAHEVMRRLASAAAQWDISVRFGEPHELD